MCVVCFFKIISANTLKHYSQLLAIHTKVNLTIPDEYKFRALIKFNLEN